jgi:hypothetical protein
MKKENNINYEKISSYTIIELYQLLDKAEHFEGTGITPEPNEGDAEKGNNRYQAMLRKFRKDICESEKLKKLLEEKKNSNRLEIAAVVSDLIISFVTPLAAFTFGLIISKTIYSEICY